MFTSAFALAVTRTGALAGRAHIGPSTRNRRETALSIMQGPTGLLADGDVGGLCGNVTSEHAARAPTATVPTTAKAILLTLFLTYRGWVRQSLCGCGGGVRQGDIRKGNLVALAVELAVDDACLVAVVQKPHPPHQCPRAIRVLVQVPLVAGRPGKLTPQRHGSSHVAQACWHGSTSCTNLSVLILT